MVICTVVLFSRISQVFSQKFPLQFMSMYGNESIRKIAKWSPCEFPHLVQNRKNVYSIIATIFELENLLIKKISPICCDFFSSVLPKFEITVESSQSYFFLTDTTANLRVCAKWVSRWTLKIYTHYMWVCGMETSISMLIPQPLPICCFTECGKLRLSR